MKELHKGCIRKVDNPMKWMEEDKSHFEIKKELQKFLSENDYILNLVGAENESALLLVAEHFANWNGMQHAKEELTGGERLERLQPSLASDLDEAAEEIASNIAPTHPDIDWDECFEKIKEGIKAGAEWMAGQGVSMQITDETEWADVDSFVHKNVTGGAIIQIRKK